MKKFSFPSFLKPVHAVFERAGHTVYLVGGAVRDIALGMKPVDFDLATDASPGEVMKLFKRVIPTGIDHGTVTVLYKNYSLEITTFRTEGKYSDGRRPDTVEYSDSLYEDLRRRDFTINAMAIDLGDGTFIDPHNGMSDLSKKQVRAIGNPLERFSEDGLRPLRAIRFACQLEFSIEAETHKAIPRCLDILSKVSIERVQAELEKILISEKPSIGLFLMDDTGILGLFIPELSACREIPQKGIPELDLLRHSILTCDGSPPLLHLRLSALLHDIGKPEAMENKDGDISFHEHEVISAEMSDRILDRLKFPVSVKKKVHHLIVNHMFNYTEKWSDAAVRRFISRVGRENIEDLLRLRQADVYGTIGEHKPLPQLMALEDHIRQIIRQENAFSIRDLALDGNLLHEKANIPKDWRMGKVMEYLLEAVLDDPSLNREEHLLEIARNYYSKYFEG